MEQKGYIKAVMRGLKCSGAKKKEIKKQLESDIGIALEEGRPIFEVLSAMGSASELAAEFNENMTPEEQKKAKQARIGKIVAVVLVLLVAVGVLLYWWLPKAKWVGPDGGDKETRAKERAQEVVELLDAGDYEALQANAIALMEDYLTADYMDSVKAQLTSDWGKRVSVGTGYVVEVTQQGQTYQIVELQAVYENVSVIYSITLDEELRLAGLYMR